MSSTDTTWLPSQATGMLGRLVGRTIVKVTRYSWWSPQEVVERYAVAEQDVFSLTLGPLAIEIDDGFVLAVASEVSRHSICVWTEREDAKLTLSADALETKRNLHPISIEDSRFSAPAWRHVVGTRVARLSVLVCRPLGPRFVKFPNEVGLCLSLDSGTKIIASHGLHDRTNDFSVIEPGMIHERLRPMLTEVSIAISHPTAIT